MYSRIRQLFFLLFGISYAAIACGDAYRCLDSTGHFEYRNIPCSSDNVGAQKITATPEVEKSSSTPLKDGSTCPMVLAPKPEPSGYGGPIRQDRIQSSLSWPVRPSRNCMALPHSC